MSRIPNNVIEIGTTGWKCSLPVTRFIEDGYILVDYNMESLINTKNHPWRYEVLEQYLTNKWINEKDIVLELGGGIGIVSLTINSKLKNKEHHVVVEPNKQIMEALKYNKKSFKSKFKICNKAISEKPLKYIIENDQMQNYTIDNNINSQDLIDTINFTKFKSSHNLKFNVLVAYCEGCLEYFLLENEKLLEQLNLIIFEKDNSTVCNYDNIFKLLKKYHFIFRDGLINDTKNDENFLHQVWSK